MLFTDRRSDAPSSRIARALDPPPLDPGGPARADAQPLGAGLPPACQSLCSVARMRYALQARL